MQLLHCLLQLLLHVRQRLSMTAFDTPNLQLQLQFILPSELGFDSVEMLVELPLDLLNIFPSVELFKRRE